MLLYISLFYDPGKPCWYITDVRTGEVANIPNPPAGGRWTLHAWPEKDLPTYCSVNSGKTALWEHIFC